MSRIIFINRYFFPDHSATSQILSDLAFRLGAGGRDVHVITSRQIYDDPTVLLPKTESIRGISVHRVRTTNFGRGRLIKRAFDYLTFYLSAARCLMAMAKAGDVIVAKTDPPLLSVLAFPIAYWHSARLVNWLQDLYPEVAVALGIPLISQLAGPIARLRDISLRRAACNVAISASMADRLRKLGVSSNRVAVIHNWSDDRAIFPVNAADNPLRTKWGLKGKFVVGYSGNLGRAHEFDTILAAANNLRAHPDVAFVVIGGGKQFELLAARVRDVCLSDAFRFLPYQPREQLRYSLTLPDVHWISMRPEVEGTIFPSKFFGVAAAGRPIIALTARQAEMASLVREHACGCVVEPGDAEALTEVILRLARDPQECEELGRQARAMLEAKFTRDASMQLWQDLLGPLLGQKLATDAGV